MNGKALRDFVRSLLFENVAAVGSGIGSDAELAQVVALANEEVWQWVVEAQPSLYAKRVEATVSSATGYLDLEEGFAGKELPADLPVVLGGDDFYRIVSVLADDGNGGFRPLCPGLGQQLAGLAAGTPRAYYLEGDRIFFAPPPTADLTVRITYVPPLATIDDATEALGGKLAGYHNVVAYQALTVLAAKDEADPKGWIFLRDERRRQMLRYLAKKQRQVGRKIRDEDYE